MEVYLDNSATTRPYKEVVETVTDILNNNYANPSSLHSLGKKAEDSLKNARQTIARTLNCNESEIIFTSGGTESDNLAILGYAMANRKRGNKLITQKTEHMAVLQGFKFLESQGFSVYYADVDENGFVDIDDIMANVDDNTILVSIMHVNNETGAIMDIEALSKRLDHSKCVLHVDAVQSYGKININTRTFGADMISISSHKIHGPNGVGALYVKDKIRLNPVMHGGNQEAGLRSGTENLAGICGFAKAAEIKFAGVQKTEEHISNLKKTLLKLMSENIDNVIVNSPENSIYSILNVAFPGLKSEVLLHILESKGIYISTGSACNSKKKLNYVLKSMGIKDNLVDSSIRFSFSEFNTMEDITYVVEVLKKEVPLLRKIMR